MTEVTPVLSWVSLAQLTTRPAHIQWVLIQEGEIGEEFLSRFTDKRREMDNSENRSCCKGVCMVRERERESEGEKEKERERERESEWVSEWVSERGHFTGLWNKLNHTHTYSFEIWEMSFVEKIKEINSSFLTMNLLMTGQPFSWISDPLAEF